MRRLFAICAGLVGLVMLAGSARAAPSSRPAPHALGTDFAELAARVGPATVHIESRHESVLSNGLNQLSRDFAFTLPQQAIAEISEGPVSTGSGVIIDPSGLVLTNHHVVGSARTVMVTLHDKQRFEADVIGSDPRTDVSVLRLHPRPDARPFSTARLGDSDAIRVGEWVMAVGHPFDFQFSVTVGILSARGRRNLTTDEIQDYLQTDAAVNPGSSGGPLFNMHGELVGINTAIFNPSQTAQNAGIAFAIPSNMAVRIARDLQSTGRVGRAVLGVDATTRPATTDNPRPGVEITRIFPESAAEQAGLRRGDVVLSIDGEPVADREDLRSVVLARGPEANLTLGVERGLRTLDIRVQTRAARDSALPGFRMPTDGSEWAGMILTPTTPDQMATLGVLPPEDERFAGLLVLAVAPASTASVAGLKKGDIVVMVAGMPIESPDQLATILDGKRSATIQFLRDGRMFNAVVGGLERRSP